MSTDQRFLDFLYLQAQNGGLFLGQIPNPATGEPMVNLKAATMILDSLEMLEDKTEGNLSEEESTLLASALKNLRPLYDRICDEHTDDDE
jgi:hypothetical protein